ncbi:MAG: potassium channel family protein [Actinomycetota bacterium]
MPVNDATVFVRRLLILGGVVAGVFVYGIAGYMLFGFGLVDAAYMTTLAVTTAGFNPVRSLDGTEQVFTMTIAVFGVSMFIAILTVLGGAIAEGQLAITSRRRRMQRRIDSLRDHFIVCAYGRVGRTTAREFEADGAFFVVIDSLEELEDQMVRDGVDFIVGDPSSEVVLRAAGIERARGLVCAMDSDAVNVFITLMARSLNETIFIVARASEATAADRLYKAGADRVVSPYVTSGRHMALLAQRPRVVDYLELASRDAPGLRLDEIQVEPGSTLVQRSLHELSPDIVPLAVRRADGEIVPNPDPTLRVEAGDLLIVLGDEKSLRAVEE